MTEYSGERPPSGSPAVPGRGGASRSPSEPSVDGAESYEAWLGRSRMVLTPIAAPSILGLFGFASSTFMVASNLAGWWGNTLVSPVILAPLVIFFGGLAQLAAGMWAYRARDAVATAMHGTWGAFWLAWGMTQLMVANGLLPLDTTLSQAFGFWWIVLAVTTIFGALASFGRNLGMFLVLGLLAAGSALLAAGILGAVRGLVQTGGWVLIASSAAAWYTAGAMMLEESYGGRVILPLGRWSLRGNLPGHKETRPIEYAGGMPGAKVGQ
ncbi:acetate uptake transporter [Streptomyces triticisoli]|uniref:acetate uptake transporter n=1 Tax=Streptomyces triticisoli TaxID=2182797 RepID=UPI000DDAA80F|nr:GPR1/FUN34/YaaH family transporter [Streptomyces triticisoli]